MIDVFLSIPKWKSSFVERKIPPFFTRLDELGFSPKTIGTNIKPLISPFDEVISLMNQCQCTIIFAISQIYIYKCKIKNTIINRPVRLPTEWNHIEASISIMLKKPTLVLFHKGVEQRGIFERGAANIFVHEFDTLRKSWVDEVTPYLEALRGRVNTQKGINKQDAETTREVTNLVKELQASNYAYQTLIEQKYIDAAIDAWKREGTAIKYIDSLTSLTDNEKSQILRSASLRYKGREPKKNPYKK